MNAFAAKADIVCHFIYECNKNLGKKRTRTRPTALTSDISGRKTCFLPMKVFSLEVIIIMLQVVACNLHHDLCCSPRSAIV